MSRVRLIAASVALAFVAAACGGTAAETATETAEVAAAPTAEAATAPAAEAAAEPASGPTISGVFETFDSGSIDLTDFEGEDVVFWFWAPW